MGLGAWGMGHGGPVVSVVEAWCADLVLLEVEVGLVLVHAQHAVPAEHEVPLLLRVRVRVRVRVGVGVGVRVRVRVRGWG